jgi:aspartate carbamoyltransferase catalytic subunit
MSREDLRTMLSTARDIDPDPRHAAANPPPPRLPDLRRRMVATLFFEDSTRTRTSFTIAAHRLGMHTADLSAGTSSVNKGETITDTARNVEAMGVDALIVRARQAGAADIVARSVSCAVINAGDGRHEHPTQGLLDALTIAQAHARDADFDLAGLTVAIVGDVASSRVARSNIAALATLGARVVVVGPPGMVSPAHRALGCEVSNELDPILPEADAVMMLRIQFERHGEAPHGTTGNPSSSGTAGAGLKRSPSIASIREYRAGYAMTAERARLLGPRVIVMHPGPINRGLELDAEVADSPRSAILRQVSNGVRVRMAALWLCLTAGDRGRGASD